MGVPRLGNFEAGAVASLTSPVISAVNGGLATMAGAVAIRLAFPALARYGAPGQLAATGSPHPEDPDAPRGDARGEQRPGKS